MHRLLIRFTVIVVASSALGSCAGGEHPSATAPQKPAARPHRAPSTATTSSVTPAAYVSQASSIDLFIIGSSELALQRSTSPRTREFAETELAAHRGTSAQLSFAGRRLNLLPSATLQPRHQAMINALQSSSAFDAAYRSDQLTVHQEGLALHRNFATRGKSPTLKPVASNAVAIFERHLRTLRYL